MTELIFTPDLERLSQAFDNNSAQGPLRYFLDRFTGQVLVINRELLSALEDHDPATTVEADLAQEADEALRVVNDAQGRFVEVEGEGSRPVFDNMLDFADTVTDPGLRAALEHALQERHPFRHFKKALVDYAVERERWHAYRDEQRQQRVRRWLRDAGLPDFS